MALATILVVVDTAEALDLTASVLKEAGYEVVCCAGSRDALAVLNNGHVVDLLVTDIVMPELDGFELARRARVLRPSMPIVYTANVHSLPNSTQETLGPILPKSDVASQLTQRVEELLAPAEDARLVRTVALDMIARSSDAYERVREREEDARMQGDDLSATAWRDIAEAIARLQRFD